LLSHTEHNSVGYHCRHYGLAGVPLKPSTVLIFSVALGIAIDITIRFLVNYKQQLKDNGYDTTKPLLKPFIHRHQHYLHFYVLTAGFVIFYFSGFGGTKALGWLTSVTLITATVANLFIACFIADLLPRKKGINGKRNICRQLF
jgi:predicted RND superfamily exporter protein